MASAPNTQGFVDEPVIDTKELDNWYWEKSILIHAK